MDLRACCLYHQGSTTATGKWMAAGVAWEMVQQSKGNGLMGSRLVVLKPVPGKRRISSRNLFLQAKIEWGVDRRLDMVIERDKKVKLALRIKTLLARQPDRVMSLQEMGEHRRFLGLVGKDRCIDLLNKFPAMFHVFHAGSAGMLVKFTPQAEEQFLLENKTRAAVELSLVDKLRKLLMMSFDRKIGLDKLTHLKVDLGLPDDFAAGLVHRYPDFFRCVSTDDGVFLELTSWDPTLAVSAMEKKLVEQGKERKPEKKKLHTDWPQGYRLRSNDKRKIAKFQEMPYVSPYSDAKDLDPNSFEAEKRAVAVVHEFLSLTLEKKTRIDFLTHFRSEYKFSQRLYAMLLRHPEVFYVSRKGHRDSVFLREAYNGSEVIERDPLLVANEFFADLATSKRVFQKEEIEKAKEEEISLRPVAPRIERRQAW